MFEAAFHTTAHCAFEQFSSRQNRSDVQLRDTRRIAFAEALDGSGAEPRHCVSLDRAAQQHDAAFV
jgi:hypothetical protein